MIVPLDYEVIYQWMMVLGVMGAGFAGCLVRA